jgi:hypothetical protein
MSEYYGKTKSFLFINLMVGFNVFIIWKSLDILSIFSFISLLTSYYFGTETLSVLQRSKMKNIISLICWSFVDTIIMCGILLNKMPYSKVANIFIKDFSFKCLYSLIISLAIFALYNWKNIFNNLDYQEKMA